MKTNDKHIVILLSDKGYVAMENAEVFQLWKHQRLAGIYDELHQRYPYYEIHLGSLEEIPFNNLAKVCISFLANNSTVEVILNSNKDLVTGTKTMETRNKAKVKAVAVIGINITAGIMHLGFQTMADTVCYAEAKLIDKLNVFDKTVEEIMKARQDKTKETQQSMLNAPEHISHHVNRFYCRIREIKDKAIQESQTATQNL